MPYVDLPKLLTCVLSHSLRQTDKESELCQSLCLLTLLPTVANSAQQLDWRKPRSVTTLDKQSELGHCIGHPDWIGCSVLWGLGSNLHFGDWGGSRPPPAFLHRLTGAAVLLRLYTAVRRRATGSYKLALM